MEQISELRQINGLKNIFLADFILSVSPFNCIKFDFAITGSVFHPLNFQLAMSNKCFDPDPHKDMPPGSAWTDADPDPGGNKA